MICPNTTANGTPCTNTCQHGMEFCASHNPDMKRIRAAARAERDLDYAVTDIEKIDRQIAALKVRKAELVKLAKRRSAR